MSTKPIDTFITNSVKLFEVNPSQTTFTILYQHRGDTTNEKGNKKVPQVSFKTHNGSLSTNYKFTTRKSKDVSRLLSALGPKGVSIALSKVDKKVRKANQNKSETVTKKKRAVKQNNLKDVVGLSTLLVNTDVKEYVPVQESGNLQAEKQLSSKKKKQNKNKNKKRR